MKTYKATINWQWKDKAGNDQVTSETIELSEARLKQLLIDAYDGWYSDEGFVDWCSLQPETLEKSFERVFKENPFESLEIHDHYDQVPYPADIIIDDFYSVWQTYEDKEGDYDYAEDDEEFNSPRRVAEFIDEVLDAVEENKAEAEGEL